jgi:hypothetical protein
MHGSARTREPESCGRGSGQAASPYQQQPGGSCTVWHALRAPSGLASTRGYCILTIMSAMYPRIQWPDGKTFAFTIFDDPDRDMLTNVKPVYDFLHDLGIHTTKGVWMREGVERPALGGMTCEDAAYRDWILSLQKDGFEIGWHNACYEDSPREVTEVGLERFKEMFGNYPSCMSNHYRNTDAIYWGAARLSGLFNLLYKAAVRSPVKSEGHLSGSRYFWGDLCREKIRYVRNFVYPEINTLKACPGMPYRDVSRPYVNGWYASAEGNNCDAYVKMMSEQNLDRLAAEGGACIMYTHFAKGFSSAQELDGRFRVVMERLAGMNGWFVPVSKVLDYLGSLRSDREITKPELNRLEWRWLMSKATRGSS